MKVLITGIGGFMGQYLSSYLVNKGHEVFGTYFTPTTSMSLLNNSKMYECDIRDRKKLERFVKKVCPDQVYHLAAQSLPTESWIRPEYTFETNVMGTFNILESVRHHSPNSKIFLACSSAEYGFVGENEVPVKEHHSLLPLHPYGISKVSTDLLGYLYSQTYGLKIIRARIFNTTGPLKINDVCSDFTRRVAEINKSLRKPRIRVGNLDSRRAITDVRDIIRAFFSSMDETEELFGRAINYSGSKVYLVKDILDIALSFSDKDIEIFVDDNLLRSKDEPIIYGDSTILQETISWNQEIDIRKTLEDMYTFWMKELEGRDE
tara:strand:- start:5408 stop:6367 length:960 start_codon:yes stop_codon:yes gene_type:complete